MAVTEADFWKLFEHFTTSCYSAYDPSDISVAVQINCEELFAKDYKFSIVDNNRGKFCIAYPSRIVFLEEEKSYSAAGFKKSNESKIDLNKYKNNIKGATYARCRTRFPVPVIICNGKRICRSSTLSCGKEILLRKMVETVTDYIPEPTTNALNFFFPNYADNFDSAVLLRQANGVDENVDAFEEFYDIGEMLEGYPAVENEANVDDVARLRENDLKVLKDLSVTNIFDLMVEERKAKANIYVSSSEKADLHHIYRDVCTVMSIPYPGCEFFAQFGEFNYDGTKMKFNWNQPFINRLLELPAYLTGSFDIDWKKYKDWDLDTLTQYYMKAIVKCLNEGTSGLLVHCISGWDRTPLFISMLRLFLWASGKIHKSLTPLEMLYLTVGYDWFLFGHQLPSRLKRSEEVMHYCFYALRFLHHLDISVTETNPSCSLEKDCSSNGKPQPSLPVDKVKSTSTQVPESSPERPQSTDSFVFVGETGSAPSSASPKKQTGPCEQNPDLKTSMWQSTDPEVASELQLRQKKLKEVQRLFLFAYFRFLPPEYRTGGKSGIVGYINRMAEMFGFKNPLCP